MQFATWEPIYRAILDDFGFSMSGDEDAAKLLAELLRDLGNCLSTADARVRGRRVVVFGNAPSLDRELDELQVKDAVFLAADGATAVL